MSQQQNTWDDLVQSWEANETAIENQVPSNEVLIAQINKRTRDKKIELVVAVIASTALASYIVFEMMIGLPSIADTILYSVVLVMSLSIGVYTLISTKRFMAVSTQTTHDHATTLLKQTQNSLKVLSFSQIFCSIALVVGLSLLGLIVFVALNKPLEPKHYVVGGIALGCSLLFTGILVWFKKLKAQHQQQIAFLTNL